MDGSQSSERSGFYQLEESPSVEECWRQNIIRNGNSEDPLAEKQSTKGQILGQGRSFLRFVRLFDMESYKFLIKVSRLKLKITGLYTICLLVNKNVLV